MSDKGDFASMFESSPAQSARRAPRLEAGKQVEGVVLAISGGLVVVDIGTNADAKIDLNEFQDRAIQVGDKIRATVKNPRQDGPELTLSLGRGGGAVSGAVLQLALESGTPVSGSVTAAVKGGFSVDVAGTRAFCPISQIDVGYVTNGDAYVGQTLDFRIIEIREGGRNVVVSRKALVEEQRRANAELLLGTISEGAIVTGKVKSAVRHGVVVDLGGLDGFIHISELSRSRVERPEDVVTIGEDVTTKVLSIEKTERGLNVRLSLKALSTAAAPAAGPSAQVEEILSGKVARHVPNGIIVATEKGEGLVPTRELELAPGADHRRTYPVGHELRVVVVSRDGDSGRMRFSVGRVAQVEERQNYKEFSQGAAQAPAEAAIGSFGALLAKKLGQTPAASGAAAPAAAKKNPVVRGR